MKYPLSTPPSFEKHLVSALAELCGTRQWTIRSHTDGTYELEWHEENTEPPIDYSVIETLALQHEAVYNSKEYQRSRKAEYPEIGDQLDMLWHALDSGTLDKSSQFYTSLKTIKDKYPKP
jgi:hypothetical protein